MSAPVARSAGRLGVPRLSPRRGLILPGAWVARALCAQADPDVWFPDEEDHDTTAAAIAVCARCPVRPQCLAHALATGERHGVWGGLTARQRRTQSAGEQEKAA